MPSYKFFKQPVIGNLVGIAMVLLVALLAATAHCAVGNPKYKPNATGFVQYEVNPYMYIAASFPQTPDFVSIVDGNLNLRLKPIGTYMLYDENLLLCGVPGEKFEGVGEFFVITYERVSHRTVQGVGCHELVRVDSIKKKEVMQ